MSLASPNPLARAAAILVTTALCVGGATGVAAAGQRYASPTGSALAACTAIDPCSLATAIQSAADNDEVIVTPGTQPYMLSSTITDSAKLAIHGADGMPRPVIVTSAFIGLAIDNGGSTLRFLDLRDTTAGGGPLVFSGSVAEQLLARGGGSGNGVCDVNAGILRDSVCVASDAGAAGVLTASTGTQSVAVRNVTAINTSSSGFAVYARGLASSAHVQMTLANVIARGGTGAGGADIKADVTNAAATVAVSVTHGNYANASAGAHTTIVDDGTKQAAAPVFADFAAFDYHQLAGSPTIDAGVTDPLDGALDVDGDARSLGAATDIGADEYVPPAPPPPPGGPPPPVPAPHDTTAPVISAASLAPARFAALPSPRHPARRVHRGTTLRFTLSEAARVHVEIARRTVGRRVGRSCRAQTRANRRHRACVRYVPVGSFTRSGVLGRNAIAFSGRLGRHALAAGAYRLQLVATDAAKNRSRTRTLTFTLLRG